MNVYKVTRHCTGWCEDFAMIVIAEDEKHAERRARLSSDDFKKDQTVKVERVIMDIEQCVLTANSGA